MATIRVPIDLRNPRVASLAGNAFFTVEGLTAYDAGRWEFVAELEGKIYGLVAVPKTLHATPNGKVVLVIAVNATSGATRLQVSTKAVANAESLNPASLTGETAQNVTVPATARLRKDVSFTLTEVLAADDVLLVEVFHDGDDAGDTLAAGVPTLLYAAFLECDVT